MYYDINSSLLRNNSSSQSVHCFFVVGYITLSHDDERYTNLAGRLHMIVVWRFIGNPSRVILIQGITM
jgi:hypothetical protein